MRKLVKGSPPHARGKDGVINRPCVAFGITPARAGKSQKLAIPIIWHGDHPRTRGEKLIYKGFTVFTRGSPPHARGKGLCGCEWAGEVGITPARAGKSPKSEGGWKQ